MCGPTNHRKAISRPPTFNGARIRCRGIEQTAASRENIGIVQVNQSYTTDMQDNIDEAQKTEGKRLGI